MTRNPAVDANVYNTSDAAAADVVADAGPSGARAASSSVAVHIADGSPRPSHVDLVVALVDDPAQADLVVQLVGYEAPADPDPGEGGDGSPTPPYDVLFVAGNSATPGVATDQPWIDLIGTEHNVTVADDSDAAVSSGYDIVVLGRDAAETAATSEYAVGTNMPCLALNYERFQAYGYTAGSWSGANQTQDRYTDDTYLTWQGQVADNAPITVSTNTQCGYNTGGPVAGGVVWLSLALAAGFHIGAVFPPGAGPVTHAVGYYGHARGLYTATAAGEQLALDLVEAVVALDAA